MQTSRAITRGEVAARREDMPDGKWGGEDGADLLRSSCFVNAVSSHESATFRGAGGHFCGLLAQLATSQGCVDLPAQTLLPPTTQIWPSYEDGGGEDCADLLRWSCDARFGVWVQGSVCSVQCAGCRE